LYGFLHVVAKVNPPGEAHPSLGRLSDLELAELLLALLASFSSAAVTEPDAGF
jgi:hypothetical protein